MKASCKEREISGKESPRNKPNTSTKFCANKMATKPESTVSIFQTVKTYQQLHIHTYIGVGTFSDLQWNWDARNLKPGVISIAVRGLEKRYKFLQRGHRANPARRDFLCNLKVKDAFSEARTGFSAVIIGYFYHWSYYWLVKIWKMTLPPAKNLHGLLPLPTLRSYAYAVNVHSTVTVRNIITSTAITSDTTLNNSY